MFKINNKDSTVKSTTQVKEKVDRTDETNDKSEINDKTEGTNDKSKDKPEKIETCYFCLQKFDMNKDDCSHYKYGKFPMCDYCSQFYGFYDER
ncbi:MAG: hypothetical protein HVN34_06800 [Methanobacteriaceae archaeon]|nr:hypothetical protein [Methanobacteriaceae archaeon]OPY22525.1 MAG: hypothetical protein A4E26_01279 [Methanobacterium sp. PtaU1.Bin097]